MSAAIAGTDNGTSDASTPTTTGAGSGVQS